MTLVATATCAILTMEGAHRLAERPAISHRTGCHFCCVTALIARTITIGNVVNQTTAMMWVILPIPQTSVISVTASPMFTTSLSLTSCPLVPLIQNSTQTETQLHSFHPHPISAPDTPGIRITSNAFVRTLAPSPMIWERRTPLISLASSQQIWYVLAFAP